MPFLPLLTTTRFDIQCIFLWCKKPLVHGLKGQREIKEENTKGLPSLGSRKYLFIYIVFKSLEGCCKNSAGSKLFRLDFMDSGLVIFVCNNNNGDGHK